LLQKYQNIFIASKAKIFLLRIYKNMPISAKERRCMRRIVVANRKGGVGKTTSVQNIAVAFAMAGKKVLALDMDPQASLTTAWGIGKDRKGILDLLRKKATWREIAVEAERSSDNGYVLLAPASMQLAAFSEIFALEMGRELLLKESLEELKREANFDILLIDSPPSLDLIAVNCYVAAELVLITVQCEFFALEGLSKVESDIARVRQRLNPALDILGIVPTFFDKRKRLCRDVLDALSGRYGNAVTKTAVRDNVALAEAPSNGESIFSYNPKAYGAEDYIKLAAELRQRMEV